MKAAWESLTRAMGACQQGFTRIHRPIPNLWPRSGRNKAALAVQRNSSQRCGVLAGEAALKISPMPAALACANCLAISAAVTGSFTVASAVLTALTRSDSVFGQASFTACCFPGFASGSTSTANAVCCVWAPPGF